MIKFFYIIFLAALFFIFSGCDSTQIEGLSASQISVSGKLDGLTKRVEQLEKDNVSRTMNEEAFLTPGSNGYAPVRTDLGVITISIENVKAYANGTKVTLRFGNLTSANISGLKATVSWGSMLRSGFPDFQNESSREVVFSGTFKAGTWTNSNVVLEGVEPKEFGYLNLKSISHQNISLLSR